MKEKQTLREQSDLQAALELCYKFLLDTANRIKNKWIKGIEQVKKKYTSQLHRDQNPTTTLTIVKRDDQPAGQ